MSRTSEIKKFRSEIEGLEDHNLAEGLYDKIVEFENGTEEDKRKLHILLSTKVQELKQAEHDEKSEAGDKKGAAEAIKPEAEKDRDSDPKAKKSQKKLQTAEERAKNPEKDRYGVIKPIHVPGKSAKNPNGCELKLVSNKELKALQDEDIEAKPEKRRIVGVRPVKPLSRDLPITQYQAILRKLALVMALLVGFAPSVMGALASDDIATMAAFNQTDGWKVNADGDLVPITTNNNAIGTTSLYPSQICLNALCKTSWGDVVSPMTDAEGYTYPTDSGAVVRLYDAGYINLGAGTAVDQYILMDGDTDDWYAGVDDTDNDYTIGAGSTLGADQRIRVTDDLNNTIVTIGDNTNAYDHYLVFDGNETDMSFGYLDTYDMLVAFYGSTVDANLAFGVENSTSPLLVVWNGIDGYGAVDIDYGSADITDHSFVSDGGTTILDGGITIGDNGELITNATDDTIRIASDDADTILEVYTAFDTTGDATLKLSADLGDAVKEQWTLTSTGATNDLVFGCDTGSSGTPVTQLTLADGGVLTTIAAINSEIDDASNTSVTDVLNLQHFTSGTAAAGIGTGLTFDLENAAGTEEEHLYLDAVATVSTDASESTDLVIGQMTAGALAETLRLVGLQSATAGTSVTITSNTTETNGITDILSLANVTGTATHNAGLGITWDFEDAGGAEEQASLDVQLIVATDGQEDADIIFSQQTDGAIAETMRIVGQAEATTGDYVLISQNTQETDAVLDALVLKGVTSGTATTGMGIGISFQPEDAGGCGRTRLD